MTGKFSCDLSSLLMPAPSLLTPHPNVTFDILRSTIIRGRWILGALWEEANFGKKRLSGMVAVLRSKTHMKACHVCL